MNNDITRLLLFGLQAQVPIQVYLFIQNNFINETCVSLDRFVFVDVSLLV